MNKNEIKTLVEEMKNCRLFIGHYDAKNGNKDFMYGIQTVMEYLTSKVSDEYMKEFNEEFFGNMIDSEHKV